MLLLHVAKRYVLASRILALRCNHVMGASDVIFTLVRDVTQK